MDNAELIISANLITPQTNISSFKLSGGNIPKIGLVKTCFNNL